MSEWIVEIGDGTPHIKSMKELVRCKDCKYSDTYPDYTDADMPLKCLGIRYGGVFGDWYCEHGERREVTE